MTNIDARHGLRRWIKIAIAVLIAVEVVYVIAANVLLRTDVLVNLINKKPEKMLIQWESASTWLPGVVHVEGFSLRNQSKKVQIYLTLERVTGVISLSKLPFKTFHLRSANASNVDFRLRTRLDAPRKNDTAEDRQPQLLPGAEFFPDIPGYENPPDPKPEDLYPRKKKKTASPWTLSFNGIDVDGKFQIAINRVRLNADGSVKGGMNYRLRDAIHIRRAKLDLKNARFLFDSEPASDNLELRVDSKWRPFPAKGSKLPQIIQGISGDFTIRGDFLPKVSKKTRIVPGLTTFGAGSLDTTFRLDDGVLRSEGSYAFSSDDFTLQIMELDIKGSAKVSGSTTKGDGADVTDMHLEFDGYSVVDRSNSKVGIDGTGLTLDASWNDLALVGGVSPSSVDIVLPKTMIEDVSVLGVLIPSTDDVALRSGTGEVESTLSVDADGMASGTVNLDAEDITIEVMGAPMRADLAVNASLLEGDLDAKRFKLEDTSVKLTDVVGLAPTKKSKPVEPWWTTVDLAHGTVTFGAPLTASGSVRLRMLDTRAIVAMLSGIVKTPKWMSLMPNVKNVDGKAMVDIGGGYQNFDDAQITGDKLNIQGWMHLVPKASNGRIYAKYKGLDTGISITDGKGKLHVSKPRKWFEGETGVKLAD